MNEPKREKLCAEYRRVRCDVDKVIRELSYTKLEIEDLLWYSEKWDNKLFTSNHETIICSIHNSVDVLKNILELIENKQQRKD